MDSLHAHTSGDPTRLSADGLPLEAVRVYAGDDNPLDLLLTDNQIRLALSDTKTVSDDEAPVTTYNIKLAAAECCGFLARRFAREASMAVAGAEGRSASIQLDQRARTFAKLSVDLRNEHFADSGVFAQGGMIPLVRG